VNSLLGVSELSSGRAWAVGYDIDASYAQKALVEHYDGSSWHIISVPEPGVDGNILYGVAANSDRDVWAVGGQRDAQDVWHPLVEHWDGDRWTVAAFPTTANSGSELLYAVSAVSSSDVYATGQAGTAFPQRMVLGRFDGQRWSLLPSPTDPTESLDPLGLTATPAAVTAVGERESDVTPNTTMVASGLPNNVELLATPSQGSGENDLFSVATRANGMQWAAGWYIDPASGNHEPIIERGIGGSWSITPTPDLSADQGDNGFAGIAAVPGGGLWAVGIQTNADGNLATLIESHR
jgi:hypothetical protein